MSSPVAASVADAIAMLAPGGPSGPPLPRPRPHERETVITAR